MSVADDQADLEKTLRERFGLECFRAGQREVIEQVLAGRDVLCVMPTGGGKSLCYQLPAQLMPGVTLVVSPLIALMKDQVDALGQRGLRATLINSTLDPAEQNARLLEVEAGRYNLLYVAPERFRSSRFVALMARMRPSLLAIDEAHCISEWGHDFRPDYARLGQARRLLGSPPCIALTATATDVVRRDIADQLDLRDPALFVTGFDRPNLRYAVVQATRDGEKFAALAHALDVDRGPSIVYASSRARCESVATFIKTELRRDVVVYHAGLDRDQRSIAQERFMSGDAEVVVATNAFGMGVDKADIRSVVHFNLPGTLEAYYQEAGRAGRDGLPSRCLLLYAPADRALQELFIENEYPPVSAVAQVYDFLRKLDDDPIELTQAEIREASRLSLNDSAVGSILRILDSSGAIEKFLPRENMAIVRINNETEEPATSLADRLSPQAHVQRVVLLGLEGLVRGRLGEPVYFRPDELAGALGLDTPALGRALKALVASLPIDYIPPFRGNAIRVTDRDRQPRDLVIDFKSLEKRKKREYDKLDRMIQYAQSRRCRRSFILGYFGDAGGSSVHCGACDRCMPDDDRVPGSAKSIPIDSPESRELLLKILSGVARAKGRFGKVVVAQMLTGSDSERMGRWALNRLSTYGILRDTGFTQKEVIDILDALTRARLIESQDVDRFKPVIALTEEGWRRLRKDDDSELVLDLPDYLARKLRHGGVRRVEPRTAQRTPSSPSSNFTKGEPDAGEIEPGSEGFGEPSCELAGDPLWIRLKALRQDWARELRQPAYCVFTNQTLEALVRHRPSTPAELTSIKGLGRARIERFGGSLLEAIAAHPDSSLAEKPSPSAIQPPGKLASSPGDQNVTAVAPSSPTLTPTASNHVSTEEWTWRLIERGFSIDDAAEIRGIDSTAIIRHLTWMVRRGHQLKIESILEPEVVTSWDQWRSTHGAGKPPTAHEPMANLWPLFIACRNVS